MKDYILNLLTKQIIYAVIIHSCKSSELYNLICIYLHQKIPSRRVRSRSEQVPFKTWLIPLNLNQFKLVYFLLGLGWTGFRSNLVGTETCDDGNTVNGDDENGYSNVISMYYTSFIAFLISSIF